MLSSCLYRALEMDNSRLRTFFTKKIENLQQKHIAQMHALKRGTSSPGEVVNVPNSPITNRRSGYGGYGAKGARGGVEVEDNRRQRRREREQQGGMDVEEYSENSRDDVHSDEENVVYEEDEKGSKNGQNDNRPHDNNQSFTHSSTSDSLNTEIYQQRIEMLEKELLETAEENGRHKALIAILQANISKLSSNNSSMALNTPVNGYVNNNPVVSNGSNGSNGNNGNNIIINSDNDTSKNIPSSTSHSYNIPSQHIILSEMEYKKLNDINAEYHHMMKAHVNEISQLRQEHDTKIRDFQDRILQLRSHMEEQRIENLSMIEKLNMLQEQIKNTPVTPEMKQFMVSNANKHFLHFFFYVFLLLLFICAFDCI